MKVLVTGGAGFIGSNVVDAYVASGHDVVVVDNLFTGKRENLNPSARFYETDIRSDDIARIFDGERPDVVNHHAAQMSVPASVEDPRFDADVNVLGLLNVLESCRRSGTRKIIFISTGGAVYGDAAYYPTAEDAAPRPFSPYAITKFVSEHYLGFYSRQYGIDHTVLRYANIYGPRQVPHGEAGVVAIFMEKLYRGELPTIYNFEDEPDGMVRDYCFVGDVVGANLISLNKGSGEVFNIGTGNGTTTGALYRTILKAMRASGYAGDAIFDSPGKGPARDGDLRISSLDVVKAERQLGWKAGHDLEKGVEYTLRWFLESVKAGS